MTSPNEFNDMMPHTITVQGSTGTGSRGSNYGGRTATGATRTYRCLLDQGETLERSTGVTEFRKGLTAYVNPIAINTTAPTDILENEIVTVNGKATPVDSIERHWDESGLLFSLVVRFE